MRFISFTTGFWPLNLDLYRHRVFAELLEQGTRSTLKIPNHTPPPGSSNTKVQDVPRGPLEVEGMRALGLNPNSALQHPGFYYYMAARCTENRRDRFLAAAENEVSPTPSWVRVSAEQLVVDFTFGIVTRVRK